jgi:hypothetical protein
MSSAFLFVLKGSKKKETKKYSLSIQENATITFLERTYVAARKSAQQMKSRKCGRRVNSFVLAIHALHSMLFAR